MSASFRFVALDRASFAPLFALDDAALAARDVRRIVVDEHPGYPCRVSLADAAIGETVLLLAHAHHDAASPYRASGPIFVRDGEAAAPSIGEIPTFLRHRLLSLRAYDADAMMRAADVVQGDAIEAAIGRLLDDSRVAYLHVHNARPGCYMCHVERA